MSYQEGLHLHPEQYRWYDKIMVYFFGMFKFGHEAVILFFVLSGFVIHLKWAGAKFKLSDFKLGHYLSNRVIRIYPTLLTSLILSILIEMWINRAHLSATLSAYDFSLFLNNFFLIPESAAWGSNWPIWSLKHEWFFYLLYPVLLFCSFRHRLLGLLIPILLFMAYQFGYRIAFLGNAAYTLMIWCLGCVLAHFYRREFDLRWFYPALALVTVYPFFSDRHVTESWGYFTFGLICTGFFAIVLDEKLVFLNRLFDRFAWLGKFSYSMYLLHFPLLVLFGAIFMESKGDSEKPYHLWYVLFGIVVVLPLTYLIYYFTERPALKYKKSINR